MLPDVQLLRKIEKYYKDRSESARKGDSDAKFMNLDDVSTFCRSQLQMDHDRV